MAKVVSIARSAQYQELVKQAERSGRPEVLQLVYVEKFGGLVPSSGVPKLIGGRDPVTGIQQKGWVNQFSTGRDIELYPGVWATSDKYCKYLITLVARLNQAFPVDTWKSTGFEGNGVETGFHNLRTVAGQVTKPMGTPIGDSKNRAKTVMSESDNPLHQQLIANDMEMNDDEKTLFFNTFKLMCGFEDPGPVPVRLEASTGLWTMEKFYNCQRSAQIIREWIINPERYIEMIDSDRLEDFAAACAPICYVNGYRFQLNGFVDKEKNGKFTPKKRVAYTVNEEYVECDFNISDRFTAMGMYANRMRMVSMGNVAMFPIRMMARAEVAYFKKKFPNLFDARPENVNRMLVNAVSVEIYDIKEFDMNVTPAVREQWAKAKVGVWDSWALKLINLVNHAPTFVRSDIVDLIKTKFRGDYTQLNSFLIYNGIKSGDPFTTGQGLPTATALMVEGLVRRGDIPDSSTESVFIWLSGFSRMSAMICQGDNCLLVNYYKVPGKLKEYCKFAILEETSTFVGKVLYRAGNHFLFSPNPESAAKKLVWNDKGLAARLYWAHGIIERRKYYDQNPVAAEVMDMCDLVAEEVLGMSWTGIAKRYMKDPNIDITDEHGRPITTIGIDSLNQSELDFLRDPLKINYSIDPSDVRPEILDLAYSTYSQESLTKLISLSRSSVRENKENRLFKGGQNG